MPSDSRDSRSDTSPAGLPSGLRLLIIGSREPTWPKLALRLDDAGCREPQFKWVSGDAEAVRLLRGDSFDCVVIDRTNPPDGSLELLQGLRTAGCDDPVIVAVTEAAGETWARAVELDADLLVTPAPWDSAALVPLIARAVARIEIVRENHRLGLTGQRRDRQDRHEAASLLAHQRRMLAGLPATRTDVPEALKRHYQELLRTYVMMGSGNLDDDIARLARQLAADQLGPSDALALHVDQVEALARGLGNRSTRHVLARADLLALELLLHLGEQIRKQVVGSP